MCMNIKKTLVVGVMLILGILIMHFSLFSTSPSQGFNLLLYEPFNFAFSVFVFFIFLYINILYIGTVVINKAYTELLLIILYAILFSVIWTVIAFLALVQFHLILGGQL